MQQTRAARAAATSPMFRQQTQEPLQGRMQSLREQQEFREYFQQRPLRAQQAELVGAQTRQALGLLPLQERRMRMEEEELIGGAGLRAQQAELAGRQARLGMAEAEFGLAQLGDPTEAGRRAFQLSREAEEFQRMKQAADAARMRSEMAFMPQLEAIRGGIAGRMAGRLGINLPQPSQQYSSTPSWMQNYQPPQFPRY